MQSNTELESENRVQELCDVTVEMAVLGFSSLIVLMVSVDVKQH